jgi:hypothetical protein
MATITPTAAATAGGTVGYASASAGGDSVVVGTRSDVIFLVRNASGGSINVTFAGSLACSQGSTHNVVVACPVGDTKILVPPQSVAVDTGIAAVTYSAVTSVTVAATY